MTYEHCSRLHATFNICNIKQAITPITFHGKYITEQTCSVTLREKDDSLCILIVLFLVDSTWQGQTSGGYTLSLKLDSMGSDPQVKHGRTQAHENMHTHTVHIIS